MGKITVSVEAPSISSKELTDQVLAILHYLVMAKPELVIKVEDQQD